MTNELDCASVRDFLGPRGGGLHPALGAQLDEHVSSCESCQEYLTLDPSLLDAYDQLRRERAPQEVHHKIHGALRALEDGATTAPSQEARSPARNGRNRSWPVAALLVAAGLAAVVLAKRSEMPSQPDTAFVEDYVRRATAGEHVRTSDPEEVAAFLNDRLGVRLEPLVFEGLVVEGAEVCLLDGELGALIVYKMDGVVLSHYLIPHDGAVPRPPTVSQVEVGTGADPGSGPRVNLVTWASPKLEQALMGTASTTKIVGLALQAAGG